MSRRRSPARRSTITSRACFSKRGSRYAYWAGCSREMIMSIWSTTHPWASLLAVGQSRESGQYRKMKSGRAPSRPRVQPRAEGVEGGMEHPANPTAARRSWPRWSSMATRLPGLHEAAVTGGLEPERLRRFQVDDQIKRGGLLDG